ncbi:MAG: phosphopentomutase [Solirubrobacteraceae bacterium]
MSGRRVFVVVIDACGVGALPDAAAYGDAGTNTLSHLADAVGGFRLPTLQRLGLGSILALRGCPPSERPVVHGRLHALGCGKDSTAGHRELMGLTALEPAPTFPHGLPDALLVRVERAIGRAVICNRAYNGIAAIDDFGTRHLASGRPILYTSQDSVVQLAAHVDVLEEDELYRACRAVRELLPDVGRVIARPFEGTPGAFARTLGRRDFALAPAGPSYLDAIEQVHAVGKVWDLFAGQGFSESHGGATNTEALSRNSELIDNLDQGLVFCNLIETDQRFGHRKDVHGFHDALREIDEELTRWLERLDEARDLLVLCADHGCDPAAPHTDHTREYVPLLASFAGHGGRRHDGPLADVGASAARWLGRAGVAAAFALPGEPFVA